MKLIFEKSIPGRGQDIFPICDVPICLPKAPHRNTKPRLPEISENEMGRHYTSLAKRAHGVNDGFYPLGSCTMKHNPKINEAMASLPGFVNIHPLQPPHTVVGANEIITELENFLCEITGMDAITFQPAAGAQGEFTGLLLIKAYLQDKGEFERNEILVPDSAHGTNPASATMAGFKSITIKSDAFGMVDLDDLKSHLGPKTAGLMLTNPNTVGLFDTHIMDITRLVHEAGGLCYYDGANLNAVMGIVRPADIGFDVIHMNLHKTFSTPHGGGGPGSGPCGCKSFLSPYLPGLTCKDGKTYTRAEKSIGNLTGFYGNFLVNIKAFTYILTLGSKGVPSVAKNAVLNANYMQEKLKDIYPVAFDTTCMHEFVISLQAIHNEKNISALDVAKALLDHGMHPPTMYFPLIVDEALMIEPTETESRETLDDAIEVFRDIYKMIIESPEIVAASPQTTPVLRLDEVKAAREPKLKYNFGE
ncbi:MAG: aminomethyl-transferring glycine dehydrogenase subunit GcvPB [Clostridiales bacterium]|nr:aminomethyl-transferring glycine dehydrogenase subunit GcvPB [Clostridiales bacterium]